MISTANNLFTYYWFFLNHHNPATPLHPHHIPLLSSQSRHFYNNHSFIMHSRFQQHPSSKPPQSAYRALTPKEQKFKKTKAVRALFFSIVLVVLGIFVFEVSYHHRNHHYGYRRRLEDQQHEEVEENQQHDTMKLVDDQHQFHHFRGTRHNKRSILNSRRSSALAPDNIASIVKRNKQDRIDIANTVLFDDKSTDDGGKKNETNSSKDGADLYKAEDLVGLGLAGKDDQDEDNKQQQQQKKIIQRRKYAVYDTHSSPVCQNSLPVLKKLGLSTTISQLRDVIGETASVIDDQTFSNLLSSLKFPEFTRKDPKVRPEIAIVMLSAFTSNSSSSSSSNTTKKTMGMRRLSIINKMNYCTKHGYDFILEDDSAVDHRRDVRWSKIRVVQKWLKYYSHVLMVDEDALFMKPEIRVEDFVRTDDGSAIHRMASSRARQLLKNRNEDFSFAKFEKLRSEIISKIDIILSRDMNNMNTGVVFYRNSSWTHDFLNRSWSAVRTSDAEAFGFHDQGSFISLLQARPFSGRSLASVEEDRSHFWIVSSIDNPQVQIFNKYPENSIVHEKDIDRYKFRLGVDFILHSASCSFFRNCAKEFEFFFEESLCAFAGRKLLIALTNMDSIKKNQLLMMESGEETSNNNKIKDIFYPPDLEEATLPPLLEKLP